MAKAYYGLPSGTYTLSLSKDEFAKFIATGRINMFVSAVPCETGTAVYNRESSNFETIDRKDTPNRLAFCSEDGISHVQVLSIHIE